MTASPGIDLDEARELLHRHRLEKLPLLDDDGFVAGLVTMRDLMALRERPRASKDAHGQLLVGAAIGVRGDWLERAAALMAAGADALVLDIAHGHADHAVRALEHLRSELPDAQLVAGNVATGEGADDLCNAGADAVKVGVGPGSACTTRIVAGVGVPQLTAVLDAVAACAKHGVPVIADGGIREPGDVAKAIAAGAETVMVGNLLAGTDESPGRLVSRGGQKFKVYRGMASAEATRIRMAAEGFEPPEGTEFAQVVPEGVEATVPHRGEAGPGRAPAGRRPALGDELRRRAHDRRVPRQRAVRADHHGGPDRVPPARPQLSRSAILPGVSDPLNVFITRCETSGTRRCGVKDLFHTAGVRTTYGSRLYGDHVPAKDAVAWQRLAADGWTLAGKTNLHEFAYGTSSQNPWYGTVGNPHDPGASPAARRAARRRASSRATSRWASAPTRRARSASPRRGAASSASSRRTARCRPTAASRWCRGSTTSDRSRPTSRPAPRPSPCWRSGRAPPPPTRRR